MASPSISNNVNTAHPPLSGGSVDGELDLLARETGTTRIEAGKTQVPPAPAREKAGIAVTGAAAVNEVADPERALEVVNAALVTLEDWLEAIDTGNFDALPLSVRQAMVGWLVATDSDTIPSLAGSEVAGDAKTLDELISAGRDFNQLGRLLIEANNANFQSERLVTQTLMNTAYNKIMEQAGKIEEQANAMQKAAVAEFASAIAGAGFQILASVALARSAGKAGIAGAGMEHNAKFQAYNGVVNGIVSATNAAGKYAADGYRVELKNLEADATRLQALAQKINATLEERRSHLQELAAELKALIDAIKQILEAAVEALAVILRKG